MNRQSPPCNLIAIASPHRTLLRSSILIFYSNFRELLAISKKYREPQASLCFSNWCFLGITLQKSQLQSPFPRSQHHQILEGYVCLFPFLYLILMTSYIRFGVHSHGELYAPSLASTGQMLLPRQLHGCWRT